MNGPYKAIISDFDGTLVTSELLFSDRLKQAIAAVRAAGWRFCIATGRMHTPAIETLFNELDLHDPIVFNGGAEIVDPVSKETLLEYTMEFATVQRLLEQFAPTDALSLIYQNGVMYIDEPEKLASHRKYICKPLAELAPEGIKKLRVVYPNGKADDMIATLTKLENDFPEIHFARSDTPQGPGCDITSLKATKHQAVLHLSKLLNINPHEIIGIGDGYNDYPLLSACGYKVAIDTAPQELQDIADKVIPSQATDGVAEFLESLLT